MDFKAWLTQLRQHWAGLLQASGVLLGVVGTAVLPPAVLWPDATPWRRLAQVMTAILIGLMFVATVRRRGTTSRFWLTVAIVLTVLTLTATLLYGHLSSSWTCRYDDRAVVVGSEFTPRGLAHQQRNPDIPCTTLIADFAGNLEDVWVKASITWRHSILGGLYIACIGLVTMTLISVVQAMVDAQRAARPVGRRRRAGLPPQP
jgi:general stress protein CsbA